MTLTESTRLDWFGFDPTWWWPGSTGSDPYDLSLVVDDVIKVVVRKEKEKRKGNGIHSRLSRTRQQTPCLRVARVVAP